MRSMTYSGSERLMADRYREQVAEVLRRTYPRLATSHRLEFKNVFGAVGAYVDGRIFASCGRFGFALRIPPETIAALFHEREARPLKYFPSGHVKKEYALLHKRIVEDPRRLRTLVHTSVRYALAR